MLILSYGTLNDALYFNKIDKVLFKNSDDLVGAGLENDVLLLFIFTLFDSEADVVGLSLRCFGTACEVRLGSHFVFSSTVKYLVDS
jgi:hypothetical protein